MPAVMPIREKFNTQVKHEIAAEVRRMAAVVRPATSSRSLESRKRICWCCWGD
jgi:hypothetical protein